MRQTPGRGEGKLGCIIWATVLVLSGYIAYKAIPVKLAATQLYDYMDDQAKFGSRTSSEALKGRILKRAKDLDLPVTERDIKVRKSGGVIHAQCTFTVPLEILGFTYNWDFDLEVDRQIFLF